MSSARSILIVDDDQGLLILMSNGLSDAGWTVSTADSWAAARKRLSAQAPDLMVLDLKLKDIGGTALLEQVKREGLSVPFVVVTGQGDEKIAVEVMKHGALDYVMKDGSLLDLLPTVAQRAFTAVERDRALAEAERERLRLERKIIEVGEREQRRIGEDLHDGLGQQLTAIEMMCASLKADVQDAAPKLVKQVEDIGSRLRETIAQTRSMARGLVPVKDEPDALWASLLELAERTSALGRVKCRFDCPKLVSMDDHLVTGHLYRIAQEAVNNALKHSGAKEVVIRLASSKKSLELSISDDGCGLTANESGGMGLQVMKHRAAVIGGTLTVESKKGKGLTVRCSLPRES
jgi:signal transduction histidine kinase